MTANCKICGKEFNKIKKALTCSKECSAENLRRLKYQPKNETYLCKMCGKEFVRTNCAVTCSKKCSNERRKELKRRAYSVKEKPKDRYFERIRLRMWRIKQKVMRRFQ